MGFIRVDFSRVVLLNQRGFCPQGYLAISGHSSGCPKQGGGMPLLSSGGRPGGLLRVARAQDSPVGTHCQMQLRSLGVDLVHF